MGGRKRSKESGTSTNTPKLRIKASGTTAHIRKLTRELEDEYEKLNTLSPDEIQTSSLAMYSRYFGHDI